MELSQAERTKKTLPFVQIAGGNRIFFIFRNLEIFFRT